MISQKEMLDIIATEAVENWTPLAERIGKTSDECPPIPYRLRVVREKDGTLHWEDE